MGKRQTGIVGISTPPNLVGRFLADLKEGQLWCPPASDFERGGAEDPEGAQGGREQCAIPAGGPRRGPPG